MSPARLPSSARPGVLKPSKSSAVSRQLTQMIGQALSTRRHRNLTPATPEWISAQAEKAIATVAMTRSTWQRHHVLAEAQRIVRSTGHAADDTLAQRITAAALAEPISLPLARIDDGEMGEPAALRRRDGASVYTRHGTALYTSAEILSAERRILHAATLDGGRTVADTDVEIALADSAARGKDLNPGQVALVTEMATNGRRVALALAPAGAGKTTAMAALSHAWRNSGGTVLGLAPTAGGRDQSRRGPERTHRHPRQVHPPHRQPVADRRSRSGSPPSIPSTLLIVDEAGKAGTLQLDAVISDALAKGATVRLVGDDGQIASISAGGVLRDIAAETDALTLSQLVRFTAPEEGAASLALRAGDPSGIGFYIDHGRVHVGADETAADMAFQAWLADQRAGRDTLLLAPTNAIVDELNVRARSARLAALAQADPQWRPGRETVLSDQLAASAGDIIRTRDNARWLRLSATDYVRNGYTYEVLDVGADGSLRVRHIGTDREITLPADYVASEVTLGYATTIDGAQGLTAGYSCHVVGARAHHPPAALCRAHPWPRRKPRLPVDGRRRSAPHPGPESHPPRHRGRCLVEDSGPRRRAGLGDHRANAKPPIRCCGSLRPPTCTTTHWAPPPKTISAQPDSTSSRPLPTPCTRASPTLKAGPCCATTWPCWPAQDTTPPRPYRRPSPKAGSTTPATPPPCSIGASTPPAAIRPASGRCAGCPPYPTDSARIRNGVNTCIAAPISSPNWPTRFARTARAWTPATAPAWAKPLIGTAPELAAEIAVFRAAHRVAPEDSRLLGAEQYAARPRTIQRLLQDAAVDAIGRRRPAVARFRQLIDSIDPRIRSDSFWPQLAEHLAQAAPSRPDLAHLVVDAASEHPLPDELPAAALWWRLSGKISHTATLDTPNAKIRPPWINDLHAVFGSAIAETIAADPAWPGLVAAIATADPKRWTPRDLLHLAAEQLADADPDGRSIAAYEYARWITHTVDMVTTADPTAHPHHNLPTPDHAPLTREEEEELAGLDPDHITPDDQLPAPDLGDVDDLQRWVNDTLVDAEPPPSHPGTPGDEEDLGSLQFEDLSPAASPHHRCPPRCWTCPRCAPPTSRPYDEHDTLAGGVATFNGPALSAAMPQIRELRAAAEADRPYWLAVQEVIDQWADADAQYDAELAQIDWAQAQLDNLLATPDTDPLDIASARADLRLRRMTLPTVSPAERFYPALTAANTARAAAAGGAEHIVTDTDVDRAIAAANDADRQALRTAHRRCSALRRDLDRAELAAAASFAAADSRPVEHVLAQQADLETELRVLAAAGQYHVALPLVIGAGSPDDRTHAAIARTTELPFTLAVVTAPPGRQLTAALGAVSDAANNADRHILWCTPTADHLPHNALGADSTSVDDLHQRLTDNTWHADRGEILIVEAAAAADPAMLADLTEHTAQQQARIILLDTTPATWPPQPSARLLHLAHTDLPWSATIADPTATTRRGAATPTAPDLEPVIGQAARLHPDMLTDDLRGALTRRNTLLREHQRANDAHRAASWMRSHEPSAADDLTPDHDLGM